ncbi:MAG TPA: hypothetical protein VIP11_26975 [Gemmatimonadaceae bacterium]
MRATYAVHIIAGSLGLISGYTALYAAKGATLHRKSGMLFIYAMLTMCTFGVVLALGKTWQFVNVPAAVMTAYLVVTSLTTVRPPSQGRRALLIGAMSFFIGQAKVIPKPIRIYGLLALPVIAVLVTLLYWLWRVRIKRSVRGIVSERRRTIAHQQFSPVEPKGTVASVWPALCAARGA